MQILKLSFLLCSSKWIEDTLHSSETSQMFFIPLERSLTAALSWKGRELPGSLRHRKSYWSPPGQLQYFCPFISFSSKPSAAQEISFQMPFQHKLRDNQQRLTARGEVGFRTGKKKLDVLNTSENITFDKED